MTVENSYTPVSHTISAATEYAVSFPYRSADEIVAETVTAAGARTVLVYNVDYTISPLTDATSGGTLTLVTAQTSGETLTLTRATTVLQPYDAPAQAAGAEASLDRLTLAIQENAEGLGRAITFPAGSSGATILTPDFYARLVGVGATGGVTAGPLIADVENAIAALLVDPSATRYFDTLAQATASTGAATLPDSVKSVYLSGREAAGDNPGFYIRVAAEPDHDWKFQDFAGEWWERIDRGVAGDWRWLSGDQSATMIAYNAGITSIDPVTDICSFGSDHGWDTGQPLLLVADRQGLTIDRYYFAARVDANELMICDTFEDAIANPPVPIDLAASPTFTIRKPTDTLGRIYRVKPGDPLDGSSGMYVRQLSGVPNLQDFVDGPIDTSGATDYGETIVRAHMVTGGLVLPEGTIAASKLPVIRGDNLLIGPGPGQCRVLDTKAKDERATSFLECNLGPEDAYSRIGGFTLDCQAGTGGSDGQAGRHALDIQNAFRAHHASEIVVRRSFATGFHIHDGVFYSTLRNLMAEDCLHDYGFFREGQVGARVNALEASGWKAINCFGGHRGYECQATVFHACATENPDDGGETYAWLETNGSNITVHGYYEEHQFKVDSVTSPVLFSSCTNPKFIPDSYSTNTNANADSGNPTQAGCSMVWFFNCTNPTVGGRIFPLATVTAMEALIRLSGTTPQCRVQGLHASKAGGLAMDMITGNSSACTADIEEYYADGFSSSELVGGTMLVESIRLGREKRRIISATGVAWGVGLPGEVYDRRRIWANGTDQISTGSSAPVTWFQPFSDGSGGLLPAPMRATGLPTHADEAAATTAGLTTGDLYITGTGEVRIKL